MATHQPLIIKLTGDSQLKKMPDMAGIFGGGASGGMRPPGGMPGGPPDMAQMLEHMPPARLEDLKAGDTVIVSSTKGASSGQVTAIMLVANAGMLVRMASTPAGAGGAGAAAGARGGPGMGGGMGGMGMGGGGGFGGLEIPGMSP